MFKDYAEAGLDKDYQTGLGRRDGATVNYYKQWSWSIPTSTRSKIPYSLDSGFYLYWL
jgi:hypothetical protein